MGRDVTEQTEAQKIRLTLSPQAQRYARRDAPREARLMASRGALPLPPIELATVLFALLHDPDAEIKDNARNSLEELPEGVLGTVLSGPAHPALLSYFAHAFKEREERLEQLVLNPATDDATIALIAAQPFKNVVEIISNNQERMLRAPQIVDALGINPLTGRAVIQRILTFLGVEDSARELLEDADDRPPEEISDDEATAALQAVLGDEFGDVARSLVEEAGDDEDDEIAADRNANLHALIQKMGVFQKIRLARLGNKEARGLLVRDRNKVVAMAALTSPKMTSNEIAAIAKARNVHDEVLRIISQRRDWTRSYQVKLALSTNPKCPVPAAMKFINYLQDRDLKSIMRSKDVPTAISTHARRILMKKGKL